MGAKGYSLGGGKRLILGTNSKNKDRIFLIIIKTWIKEYERVGK